MFEVGVCKKVIDICPIGMGVLGYGIASQRVEGVQHPIHARAFVLRSSRTNHQVAYVSVELCFLTLAVRQGVLAKLENSHPELGLNEHNVMLTAIHTHSAPGGFSHHLLYNLTIPGFCPDVYEAIVDTIVDTLVSAVRKLAPGRVGLAQGEIPVSEHVAFNRSLEAYNRNPEVDPLSPGEAAYGVDRTMTVLRFDDEAGQPLGMFSWFGVHCTSIHSDNSLIDPDNKGAASRQFEKRAHRNYGQTNFVAGFCQSTAGDVSPNFRWETKRRINTGPYDNDFQNAEYNGEIQARFAWGLFEKAAEQPLKSDTLMAGLRYEDHGHVAVEPEYAQGLRGVKTSPGNLGLSMLMGTSDGRGPLFGVRNAVRRLNRWVETGKSVYHKIPLKKSQSEFHPLLRTQGPKFSFLEVARGEEGRAFFLFQQGKPAIPGWIDPVVARVKVLAREGGVGSLPWVPQVLPIQLFVIGNFALPALPGEPTTVTGYRLMNGMRDQLAGLGVDTITVVGYANAYSGYITTHQEYQAQCYEGGSTLFGPWTFAGYQTRFAALLTDLGARKRFGLEDTGERPASPSSDELRARSYKQVA